MGFIGEAQADSHGSKLAVTFVKCLVQYRLLGHQPSIAEWSREFDTLGKQVPVARIENVLHWYCSNINQPYMLRAHTAKAFRQKFESISALMTSSTQPRIKASPEASRAADRLRDAYDWPIEISAHLDTLVEISRQRLLRFRDKVRNFSTDNPRWSVFISDRLLAQYLLPSVIESDWMPLCWQHYARRDHYSGQLNALEFRPDSELFRSSLWNAWVSDWTARTNAFDDLLDQLCG